MRQAGEGRRGRLVLAAAILVCVSFQGYSALASSYHDIYVFSAPGDGASPLAGLAMDVEGRLYGTTSQGGAYGYGTVFRLTAPLSGSGPWTEEILHSFDVTDGSAPASAVTLGSDGSIYGTTKYGGAGMGGGTAFKLANTPGWPLTVLHNFGSGYKGGIPEAPLIFGPDGLLYSTTSYFNTLTYAELGAVYSISPGGGPAGYEIVHEFGKGADGYGPVGLTAVPPRDFNGFVGASSYAKTAFPYTGTVFAEQLIPGGSNKEAVLHVFDGEGDVNVPESPPIVGEGAILNNLYGTGSGGGSHGIGGIYMITGNGVTVTTENIIYNFGDQAGDPRGSQFNGDGWLLQANDTGTLFGTTYLGGVNGQGTFFEVDPPVAAGGSWSEKVDISFDETNPIGGGNPVGRLLKHGQIYYGVLSSKHGGNGAVYELTP